MEIDTSSWHGTYLSAGITLPNQNYITTKAGSNNKILGTCLHSALVTAEMGE